MKNRRGDTVTRGHGERSRNNNRPFTPSPRLPVPASVPKKEVPMFRLPYKMNMLKTVLYGIAATVTWLLTTIYYLLAASH